MKEENSKERERLSFEEALNELDEIVQQLEKDNVSLNRSIELYQRGVELSKKCSDLLEEAELKIKEVQSSMN
ncbi:MAG: exodeoxyribonuclease VII small subunit [Balneola sp.]|nr:exodeoxyribonuclease VII small subunit [Balneola sp.]